MRENNSEKRLDAGRRAGIIGILCNLFLFAVKVAAGIFSGSVSVIADAVNNLSDAGSSVFVLVGYVLAGKPADKEHPYGHARMEYLCGLFISVIIAVLGVELLRDSAEKLFSGGSGASFGTLSVGIMLATVLVKGAMAIYYRAVAKRIDSQALRASAADSIGDMCATGAVVAGMLLTPVTGPLTDAVLGCGIAIYILILGIKLTKEASDTLIGTAPDREFSASIVKKIRTYEGVLGIHDLVIHSYGANRYFVSVHVEVDADQNILQSHDMVDRIEEDFRREDGIHMVVHMDPVQRSDSRVNEVRGAVMEIVGQLAAEYSSPASMHDFRMVPGVTHSNLIFDVAIPDDFPLSDAALCRELDEKIAQLDASFNTVITIDRDYSSQRFGQRIE